MFASLVTFKPFIMRQKTLISLVILVLSLSSCGSLTRSINGDTEKNAITNLSIATDCPAESLKVISKRKVSWMTRYQIEGCGKVYDADFSGKIYSEKDAQ